MTKVVRDLYPKAEPVRVEMCEGLRRNTYSNDAPHASRACKNRARYEIDGKKLCSKHAGPAALELLLNMNKGRKK